MHPPSGGVDVAAATAGDISMRREEERERGVIGLTGASCVGLSGQPLQEDSRVKCKQNSPSFSTDENGVSGGVKSFSLFFRRCCRFT